MTQNWTKTSFWFLSLLLISISSFAHMRPVVSVAMGDDNIHFSENQNIPFISPFHNTYAGSSTSNEFVGGVFIGIEELLINNFFGQLGVSYFQNTVYQPSGTVFQFADPNLNNFTYQYNIQSQRFFLESKILTTFKEIYHPYVDVGIGEAINFANQYIEKPMTSADVPNPAGFRSHTMRSFAYLLGAGMEADISEHVRLGAMYRYVDLGKAQLSTSTLQEGTNVIKNNMLHVNEILLQLSYLGC